jgi:transposase
MNNAINNIKLFAGIDASQKSNQCCLIDHSGEVIKKVNVTNNVTGAYELEAVLAEQAQKFQSQELVVATEATSFYDFHILEFFSESEILAEHNLKLYRFNARLIKAFKVSLKLMNKTDPEDAYAIAEYLRFRGEKAEEYRARMDHLPLQRLTRFRWHLVQQLVRERNYFLSQLFLKFSAFGRGEPFSNTFGATASAVIQEFMTPDAIANASDEELVEFVIKHGRNRFSNPEEIVAKLKYVARESYRLRPALSENMHRILCLSLANIRVLKASLKELNQTIDKQLSAFSITLTSIKGIGDVYAAGIFAEIGDINCFPSEAQVARYAGLAWKRHQSGNFEAQTTRLDKQSNAYLRYYLVEAADSLRKHNPEFRAYYKKKYDEVTKHQHKRALVLTARKLVRLVDALLRTNRLYQTKMPVEST